jgi:protein-disulfide isomerase
MRKILLVLAILSAAILDSSPARAEESGACVRGNAAAPVKIEIFSDYQCPACQQFYQRTIRPLFAEYADAGKVCVVYREFPLDMHRHARSAARYGHAALRLGLRQWGLVTDVLFDTQPEWAETGNVEAVVAKVLSADDMAALRRQLQDPSLNAAVEADIAMGVQRGVKSTPTFLITAKGNTETVRGGVSYPILKRYLDSLLGP